MKKEDLEEDGPGHIEPKVYEKPPAREVQKLKHKPGATDAKSSKRIKHKIKVQATG